MMTLEKAGHGFTCAMSGTVTDMEIDHYLDHAKRMLPQDGKTRFGLLVDQRECRLLSGSVQLRLGDVIKFFRSCGLERVAIICPSTVMALQMNRIAGESGASGVQFALSSTDSGWMAKASSWMEDGVRG